MDITLIYKWAYDPDDFIVHEDGTTKSRRGRYVASDDEAAAIVSAREVAEASGGSLAAVTI